MTFVLSQSNYGKSAIRLVKVVRDESRHELSDVTVDVMLDGDFRGLRDGAWRAWHAVDDEGDTSLGDLVAKETTPGPDSAFLDVESRRRLDDLVELLDARSCLEIGTFTVVKPARNVSRAFRTPDSASCAPVRLSSPA